VLRRFAGILVKIVDFPRKPENDWNQKTFANLVPFQNDDDLPYEEEILRNAYSVKHWMRYVEHKKNASKHVINQVYERAIKQLPGSYKLW
jgi:hypothetical protein